MAMKRILVACDAGAAGRELLTRRDLDLGWALTAKEAEAWMKHKTPDVVLTREEIAPQVLDAVRKMKRSPACVVLLDPDGWDRRVGYFDGGATGLVQASNRARILEAVSNLTGLAFASHARVPFRDVVEVTWRRETHLLETRDLSTSGVAVSGMEGAVVGERLRVAFVMSEPQVVVDGVIVRRMREDGEHVIGVSFLDVDQRSFAGLEAIIEAELAKLPAVPEPVALTSDLAGTFTIDLNTMMAAQQKPEQGFREMLENVVSPSGESEQRLPRWLKRVEHSLTGIEREALLTREPAFASQAIDARIRIERARSRVDGHGPTQDDCKSVLDISRNLASDAASADAKVLADVPNIRAALLLGVYGATRSANEGSKLRKAG
jgi:hypothetical protein